MWRRNRSNAHRVSKIRFPPPFERLDAHPISDWTLQQAVRAIGAQAMSIRTLK
jgi:hypothetical protein